MSQTSAKTIIDNLKSFLNCSVCNFFTVATVAKMLRKSGFEQLDQSKKWNLKPNGRYFIIKNGSAVFAFVVGNGFTRIPH